MTNKVFIVEDEPDLRDTLKYNFENEGFSVEAFSNGESFVDSIQKNQPNLEHNTDMGINKQTVEVLFFYADWCPHCKKAKPHWNNLKNSEKVGEGTRINNYSIVYTEVDCTDDKASGVQEKLSKFKVDGFPTIKMVKGTEVIEFDAKPELEILEGFVLQTLNN